MSGPKLVSLSTASSLQCVSCSLTHGGLDADTWSSDLSTSLALDDGDLLISAVHLLCGRCPRSTDEAIA